MKAEITYEGDEIEFDNNGWKNDAVRKITPMRGQRDLLIEQVHSRPELWDSRLLEFGDPMRKKDSWQEVANFLDRDLKEVMLEFRHLRDTFSSNLRAMQRSDRPRKWAYFDQMSFLIPVIKPRNRNSNSNGPKMTKTNEDTAHNDNEHEESNDDEVAYSPVSSSGIALNRRLSQLVTYAPSQKRARQYPVSTANSSAIAFVDGEVTATTSRVVESNLDQKDSFLIKTITDLVSQSEDTEGCFGKTVAASLRKLPHSARNWAMFKMQQVLYEASCKEH